MRARHIGGVLRTCDFSRATGSSKVFVSEHVCAPRGATELIVAAQGGEVCTVFATPASIGG